MRLTKIDFPVCIGGAAGLRNRPAGEVTVVVAVHSASGAVTSGGGGLRSGFPERHIIEVDRLFLGDRAEFDERAERDGRPEIDAVRTEVHGIVGDSAVGLTRWAGQIAKPADGVVAAEVDAQPVRVHWALTGPLRVPDA